MKKNIFIIVLFLILFGVIFQIEVIRSNLNMYKNIVDLGKTKNSYEIQFINNNISLPKNFYTNLINLLDKHNANLYFTEVNTKKDTRTITKYIYFNNTNFLNDINLNNGIKFKLNDRESKKYLSSIKSNDSNQIGEISSLLSKLDIEIRLLNSYKIEKMFNKKCYITFENNIDINTIKTDFNENNILFEIEEKPEIYQQYFNTIYIYYSVIFLIIILILFYRVLSSYKKIATQKMLGYGFFSIAKEILQPIIISELIISVMVICSFSLYNFNKLGTEQISFILNITKIFFIFIFFSIIILLLPILYSKKIKISNMIKNKKPITSILLFNGILKIVLCIIVVSYLSSSISNFKTSYNNLTINVNNWSKLSNYVVIPNYEFSTKDFYRLTSKENQLKFKELYNQFNSQGSVLLNVFNFIPEVRKDNFSRDYTYPFDSIKVNPNYLDLHKIYDTKGNPVTINESEKSDIILLPEKHKKNLEKIKSDFAVYFELQPFQSEEIKIVWIKNNQNLFSYNHQVNPENNNIIKEPIICVLTENNGYDYDYCGMVSNNEEFKIKINNDKDPLDEVNKKMLEYFDPSDVIFHPILVSDYINSKIAQEQQNLAIVAFILIFLIIIITMISIQSILVYFESQKVRIAIKKFNGYTLFDKYKFNYLTIIFSWIFICIYCFLLSPNINILIIFLVMLSFEILLSSIYLIYNENKRIISVTNRG